MSDIKPMNFNDERQKHLKKVLEKQEKTLKNYTEQMIEGKIFDNINKLKESFSDFEKPLSIKTNSKSSQESKTTPDESTTDQNIRNKKVVNHSKKDKRFPRGRLDQ